MSLQKEFEQIVHLIGNIQFRDNSTSHFNSKKIQEIILKNCCDQFKERITEEFLGCGPLHSLIDHPFITEIIINGKDQIFYEQKGIFYLHKDRFLSKWTFENFIHTLCLNSKMSPNVNIPYSNGKWNNFRVHIVISPITQQSYHITLRKHSQTSWTLEKLIQNKWAPDYAIEVIKEIVKKKLNILIAGSTSSGKTTFLNALLHSIHSNERIVSIEDTDELILPNPFSVKLLTRNHSSLPPINQSTLVQQSLRMRPDRIVMGEVRGAEAKDLIMALATGHEGSIGTIHASNHKQALIRLELLAQSAKLDWTPQAIRKMIHLGIQIIFMLKREKDQRVLQGIYQITGLETTGFLFEPLFQRDSKLRQPLLAYSGGSIRHRTTRL